MLKYLGSLTAVSLLALCGCVAYPYGGYYGGYPYSGYPYNGTPQTVAPYSYGYSYDPYGSQYGYGYGYSPGVVVPVPGPQVVVTEPPSGVVENPSDPWTSRRNRHLARERWRHSHPNGSESNNTSGDQATNPGSTPSLGNGNPGDSAQTARDWRRDRFGIRVPQTGEGNAASGGIAQTPRPGIGPGSSSISSDPRQGSGAWQAGRNANQYMSRSSMPANSRMQAPLQMRANMGGMGVSPQMRQSPVFRQPGGSPAATPRMGSAPSPQTASRPQVGQVRPQASPSGGAARETKQRPQ